MKQLSTFRAPTARVALLLLCTMTLTLPAYHASYGAPSSLPGPPANLTGGIQRTLDVVLMGPFAVLDCSNGKGIRLLVPSVDGHEPPRIGYPHNYLDLKPGEYELGIPGLRTNTMEIRKPVDKTAALSFGTKEACPTTPNPKCVYVCVDLPIPMQIVPWNADRARVSTPGGDQPHWRRLATALVLRYPVPDFKGIKLSQADDSKPCGRKKPCDLTPEQNEPEGILTLVLEPKSVDSDHKHALDGFRGLMGLVSRQDNIEFEDPQDDTCVRNQPLIKDSIPPKLIESLEQLTKVRATVGDNDCVAPMALVTDILQN